MDTPGFNRPTTTTKPAALGVLSRVNPEAPQKSVSPPKKSKPGGITPIIVLVKPSRTIVFPITFGSPLNRRCQNLSLMITTGASWPGLPSSSVNDRPMATFTPSVWNIDGEKYILPSRSAGSPFCSAPSSLPDPKNEPIDSKDWVCSLQFRYIGILTASR